MVFTGKTKNLGKNPKVKKDLDDTSNIHHTRLVLY